MIANQRYNKAVDIAKSDTVDFVNAGLGRKLCDAVYIGGAGVVAGVFEDGTVVNFTCVAGQILPVALKRVNATNTTATLMAALIAL